MSPTWMVVSEQRLGKTGIGTHAVHHAACEIANHGCALGDIGADQAVDLVGDVAGDKIDCCHYEVSVMGCRTRISQTLCIRTKSTVTRTTAVPARASSS